SAEQPVHVRGRGNISLNSQSLSPHVLYLLGYLPGAIVVDVGDDEISAGPGKLLGDGGADASASPGYDGQLAAQVDRRFSLCLYGSFLFDGCQVTIRASAGNPMAACANLLRSLSVIILREREVLIAQKVNSCISR